ALARLWQSWGLAFETPIGDGVGALDVRSAADVLRGLPADPDRLFLELGCGPIALRSADGSTRLAEIESQESLTSYAQVLRILGRLWMAGVDVDWSALHAPERRRRVPLPTYPFERERFWVEPLPEAPKAEQRNPAEWLYRPVWKTALPVPPTPTPRWDRALVFLDSHGLGLRIVEHLRAGGSDVVLVTMGPGFAGDPAPGYTLYPGETRHYALLWHDLGLRQPV